MKIVVGITGASGSLYAASLMDELSRHDFELHGVFSKTGEQVMQTECGRGRYDFPRFIWHDEADMFSNLASGTNAADKMVVVPCSMNTLACIAHGITGNLLQRIASVTLKEKRDLIVVPRETPLGTIHLENMLRLAQAGAVILPASPGFYHHPHSIDDLVRHVTGKILDMMKIPHRLVPAWSGQNDGKQHAADGIR